VVASWFAPLCLTLCVTPVLTMMSGPDVDTPDKSLAWNYPVLLLYGLFFGVGWCLHRQTHLLGILARRWQVFLPLSLVIGVIASLGVGLRISGGAWAAEHAAALRWTGSLGTSLTMSLAVLGWLGLFVRFFDRSSHSIRYLADSSYWVYLAHLPLIVGFQVWFSAWPIAWPVKVLAINACAFAILLSSYHLLIRFTWIGAWLNGRRAQRVKHTIREGVKLDYVQPGTSR
jgi:peptidoglycan/LPS O-acetylase OafA/YrhL